MVLFGNNLLGYEGLTAQQRKEFQLEILELVAAQSKIISFVLFIAIGLFAYIIQSHLNLSLVIAWLILFSANFILRFQLLTKPVTLDQAADRLRSICFFSIANGLINAVVFLFFPLLTFPEQMIITIIMIGLCAGSVSSTAGYLPLFACYCYPLFLGLILSWGFLSDNIFNYSLSFLALCFGIMLTNASINFFKTFAKSFRIRLEKNNLNRQLKKTNIRLEAALNDAIESNAAKTRFLAATGHDLSQPMQGIISTIDNLINQKLDEKTNDIVNNLRYSISSLSEQLDELLELARMDSGTTQARIVNFPIENIRRQLITEYKPLAHNKGLELKINFDRRIYLSSDPILIIRVLRNLISNALKYTNAGEINVIAETIGKRCKITVTDTGSGIPDNQTKLIFEEFSQLNNSERDQKEGLGLGLFIVKKLLTILDIEIKVSSTIGVGSTFEFEVPLGDKIDVALLDISTNSLKGCSILIVDNDSLIINSIGPMLSDKGLNVSIAVDAQSALTQLNQKIIDVVLCDYRLSGDMNGIELIQKIRQNHPDIPSILISGETRKDFITRVERENITFLSKPAQSDEIIATINFLL